MNFLAMPGNTRRCASFVLLLALGFIIYSNSLNGPFIFDDHEVLELNSQITSLSNFTSISGTRHIGYLSFALNYAAGKYNTFGYHLVNVAIHALNAICIYLLSALIFKTPSLQLCSPYRERTGENTALVAALLFLTHPIQTQAVSYISQRFASLATLFYLITIIFYIKARLGRDAEAPAARSWVFYTFTLTSAVLAQMTKEISFTLPFVLVLFELVFFDNRKGLRARLLYLLPFLLTLAIIPWARFTAGDHLGSKIDIASTLSMMAREETSILSRHDYLVTQFRVIVTYLRLLVLPIGQNLDYDYPQFHSLFTPQVLFSFLFLSLFFLSAVFLCVRSRKKNAYGTIISFGVFWFFITLSVESSLIPITDVIFEHRLYLPSIGLMLSFSTLLVYVMENSGKRQARYAVWALVAAITVANSVATFNRNSLWADNRTLWEDVVKKSPDKARGYNNIGFALTREDRIAESIPYFEKVIQMQPGYYGAYNNLGVALVHMEKYGEAFKYLHMTISIKPEYWPAYNSLGHGHIQTGEYEKALEYLEKALALKKDNADIYSNLGFALAQLGRFDDSIKNLETAVLLQPDSADAHNNLGNAFLVARRPGEAATHYRHALSIDPGHTNARANLASALSQLSR